MSLTAKTASDDVMNVLNKSGSFCRFLVARKDGSIRLFFENISKLGTFFVECPIKKVKFVTICLPIDDKVNIC